MTEKAGTGVAVLDEAVLEALGQLQGKYDAEFVARMITIVYGNSADPADSAEGGNNKP